MRSTTIDTEKTLSALADRLYVGLTAATRKVAEATLLRANPHLAAAGALRPGVVVLVPPLAGVEPAAAAADDPAAATLDALADALQEYRRQLTRALATETAANRGEQALLRREDVMQAIKGTPGAAAIAKDLGTSLTEQGAAITADAKLYAELFGQLDEDLRSLSS